MVYEYWFSKIRGISSHKKYRLREYYGDGKAIYYIEEKRQKFPDFLNDREKYLLNQATKETGFEKEYKEMEKQEIWMLPIYKPEYPEKLRYIAAPPYALYVKGQMPDVKKLSVAIVGARRCTPYGEHWAKEYGKELAKYDVEIISGMASGVDGCGHRGALQAGGRTYAVLGCGPDVCYPKEHQGLYEDILRKQGGILSEYPPGMQPLARNFPARNRIISGISDVVLVIEAKEKSGSLITADMALEQGKDVYALPGPVTSALSQGCHFLISQGAGILISPSELRKELKIRGEKQERNSDKNEKELETPENIVYSCLDLYPKEIQRIIEETGMSSREVMNELVGLELEGKVKEISKNYYVKSE